MASNLLTSKLFRQNLLGGLNGERALDLVGEMGRGWNKATGSSDCDGGDVCVCADSLAQGRLTDMPGPGGMCGVRAQASCSELG